MQAAQAGLQLKEIPFRLAFCADLGRHQDTARRILAENLHPVPMLQIDSRFREIGFGRYEGKDEGEMLRAVCAAAGMAFASFQELASRETNIRISELLHKTDPAAESGTKAVSRFLDGLYAAARQADALDENCAVLIVSSGGIMGAALEYLRAEGGVVPPIENGAVLVLHTAGGRVII